MNFKIDVNWANNKENSELLAEFFCDNVDSTYISHGEILCGRAQDPNTWSENLLEVVTEEIEEILSGKLHNKRILLAHDDKNLVGLGIIFINDGENRYAVIEDLVVNQNNRSKGYGSEIFKALTSLLLDLEVNAVFLESGMNNKKAHEFFKRNGFETISVSMYKSLK